MVVVGSDVHKRTHTFVAVDEAGRKIGELTVKAVTKDHDKAICWARERFGDELTWAIEDCRHLSARLELDLLEAGEQVVRVPPKMMAEQRRTARTRGKSDPIDALAVARAALREPDLPIATHDEASRELKLLVDRREDLVGERTRMINRLRWHLHRIAPGEPEADPAPKSLKQAKTRRRLAAWLKDQPGIDARLARDILADIDRVCPVINDLEREIAALPIWSGRTKARVRHNKSGNRQLNTALHRIAITQIRLGGLGKAYYDKRITAGDTSTEALRAPKRRLARVVFQTLKNNPSTATATGLAAAA